jgi:predicted AlkP superfamily pyrophosphatase or phosphodiesterase
LRIGREGRQQIKRAVKFGLPRFLLAALALPVILAAQAHHKLLVISIDGLVARFLSDPKLKVKAPNIRRLMRGGASATVIGVAPSETWPSDTSLVTGVSPWQHGIMANDQTGKLKIPALWDVAAKSGLTVATVYWPVTAEAGATFNFPQFREARRADAIPFDSVAQKSAPAGIVDRVEKMFPSFEKQIWDDSSSASAATYLLTADKPDLILVHLTEVDAEQHETTARSIYARDTLESDDELIGQMLAKIAPGTIVAVVSDHGFENNNHVVRPRVMLRQAGIKGRVEVTDGLIGTPDPAVAAALKKLVGQGRWAAGWPRSILCPITWRAMKIMARRWDPARIWAPIFSGPRVRDIAPYSYWPARAYIRLNWARSTCCKSRQRWRMCWASSCRPRNLLLYGVRFHGKPGLINQGEGEDSAGARQHHILPAPVRWP